MTIPLKSPDDQLRVGHELQVSQVVWLSNPNPTNYLILIVV